MPFEKLIITPTKFPAITGNAIDVERIIVGLKKYVSKIKVVTPNKINFEQIKKFNPDVIHAFHAYKSNIAVIHFDESVMPKNKKAWCSWNSSMDPNNIEKTSVTYWLNQLQNLEIDRNIFLTLNPFKEIPVKKIFKKVSFTHPYYDAEALLNQRELHKIQNKENILFCGSYFGYGFHEDGIKSSIEMLKKLND